MDKIDYLEKEHSRLIDWIKSADNRISLVLPLATAMLGAIALLSPPPSGWTYFSGLSVFFAASFLIMSITSVAIASFPRTKGGRGSMIFFAAINNMGLDNFKNKVHDFNNDKYEDDLINSCYTNAAIATIKFYWIKKSILFLFLASIPWFLSVYSLYGMKN